MEPSAPPAPAAPFGPPPWRTLLCAAVLALAALAAYANTFRVPFVFDDLTSIPDNPTLRSLAASWSPPRGNGGVSVAGRPLLNFSLAVNHALSGLDVGSYHALNLAIHILAALTLFGLLRRTFLRPALSARFGERAWPLALAIALLWTLHPLQTEAVTYVIQRAESLMALLFLLTMYGFVRSLDSARPGAWLAGSVLACLAGVATKELAALAPVAILLYDRAFVSGDFRGAWRRHRAWYLSLAATWLPLLWFLASTGGDRGGTFNFDDPAIWVGHALTQFEAVTRYAWLTFIPYPLTFDYGEIPPPGAGAALLWALPVAALLAATALAWRRWPAAAFLGAFAFLILAPTSLLPATLQIIVEHRMYLPLAAVLTLAATVAYLRVGRATVPALFALAVLAGGLTFVRNRDYRSAITLWTDTAAKTPGSARVHNNLGYHLFAAGRTTDAVAEYRRALQLDRKYIDAHDNLGSALLEQGRTGEAIAEYQAALRLKPDYPEVHYNLGNAWAKVPGRAAEAVAEYEAALRLKPDYAAAHYRLGSALAALPGRLPEALAEYEKAMRLDPADAEPHYSLGNVWLRLPGRLDDAVAEYRKALQLRPDFAEAHNNLGSAWSGLPGRMAEAVAEYREAIRLKPDFALAHFNLGNALAAQPGHLNDAIAEYQEAVRLKPDYAEAHFNLGNAWLNVPGRMTDVIAQYQEAVRLRPDFVDARLNLGNALFSEGRMAEAVAQFRDAVRQNPSLANAHFNLALALLNGGGSPAEARTHLEAALRLQPDNADARRILGVLNQGARR